MFKLNCPNCHRIVRIPDAKAEHLRETPCPICGKILQPAVKQVKQAVAAGDQVAAAVPATAAAEPAAPPAASASAAAIRRREKKGGGT
jgi:ssDNA-binding Zn-finger/Zn-ribbon topoisomerase 1